MTLKNPTNPGQSMESQVLATVAERKINLASTRNSLIMLTLFGQSLIVMEFAKTITFGNQQKKKLYLCFVFIKPESFLIN